MWPHVPSQQDLRLDYNEDLARLQEVPLPTHLHKGLASKKINCISTNMLPFVFTPQKLSHGYYDDLAILQWLTLHVHNEPACTKKCILYHSLHIYKVKIKIQWPVASNFRPLCKCYIRKTSWILHESLKGSYLAVQRCRRCRRAPQSSWSRRGPTCGPTCPWRTSPGSRTGSPPQSWTQRKLYIDYFKKKIRDCRQEIFATYKLLNALLWQKKANASQESDKTSMKYFYHSNKTKWH